jgi:phosphomannomutase
VPDQGAVIERVSAHFAGFPGMTQERMDGLTVDLGDWWFNLRPSNTEPLLRLNLEARTAVECETYTAEVLDVIRTL